MRTLSSSLLFSAVMSAFHPHRTNDGPMHERAPPIVWPPFNVHRRCWLTLVGRYPPNLAQGPLLINEILAARASA